MKDCKSYFYGHNSPLLLGKKLGCEVEKKHQRVNSKFKYILLFSLIFFLLGAAYEEVLNDKRRQAEYVEKHLENYRGHFTDKSSDISRIKRSIDSVDAKLNDLNNFLKNYESETYMTPDQVAIETNMIIYLAEEVERIQENFRKKVINLYKHGKYYDLELLFSSRSPNEYMRRNQYLQHFSQNRKKELRDLKSKKFILEEKKKMLTLSTSSQRFYVEARRNEKSQHESKLKELMVIKEGYENETKTNAERIKRYEAQLNNIYSFIANFQLNKDNYIGSKINRLSYDSGDLTMSKGNLNMPVDVGLVIKPYGGYSNSATGAISFNNGVDYSVAKGSKVFAVAGGEVTIVGELPYYGKCIIIKHENGYRSLYACLSETNISAGDNVKLNQVIGKSGETLDGQMLHFEIWKDVTPLNPGEWIRR